MDLNYDLTSNSDWLYKRLIDCEDSQYDNLKNYKYIGFHKNKYLSGYSICVYKNKKDIVFKLNKIISKIKITTEIIENIRNKNFNFLAVVFKKLYAAERKEILNQDFKDDT